MRSHENTFHPLQPLDEGSDNLISPINLPFLLYPEMTPADSIESGNRVPGPQSSGRVWSRRPPSIQRLFGHTERSRKPGLKIPDCRCVV